METFQFYDSWMLWKLFAYPFIEELKKNVFACWHWKLPISADRICFRWSFKLRTSFAFIKMWMFACFFYHFWCFCVLTTSTYDPWNVLMSMLWPTQQTYIVHILHRLCVVLLFLRIWLFYVMRFRLVIRCYRQVQVTKMFNWITVEMENINLIILHYIQKQSERDHEW